MHINKILGLAQIDQYKNFSLNLEMFSGLVIKLQSVNLWYV